MDIGIIEVVVNRKRNILMAVLRVLLIIVAVFFLLLAMMSLGGESLVFGIITLAIGVACGFGAYAAGLNLQVDYEYALVDHELRIARIQNKERRKSMGTLDLDKMEILAPEKSFHLDDFKNRKPDKRIDYSNKEEAGRYILWMEGKEEYILTLQGEEARTMLQEIRRFAPRKVWTE